MKAVVVTSHGGPEVLSVEERDTPSPAAGHVVVDTVAVGVNFMDVYAREGRPPYAAEPPFVLGAEGAGRVSAVGDGVTEIAVGDMVAWTGVPGSYAEQVAIPAEHAVPVPTSLAVEVAAAVMLQGCTAHYLASSTWPIGDGDVVVVHAAAGGVGLLLTQMAVRRGGTVVATTSGGDKAELARDAGAQHVVGYREFIDTVREITDGVGATAVYDGVGAATFDDSLTSLRRRGFMVLYGSASGPVPAIDPMRLTAGGSLFMTRPTLVDYIATRGELLHRTGEIFGWIGEGSLDVRIGGTYDLADAAKAHEDLQARRTTGKLLLTV